MEMDTTAQPETSAASSSAPPKVVAAPKEIGHKASKVVAGKSAGVRKKDKNSDQ